MSQTTPQLFKPTDVRTTPLWTHHVSCQRHSTPYVAICILLMLLAVATPATSTPRVDVETGRSYMDGMGTSTAFLEGTWDPRPLGGRFTWSPDLSLGWISGRTNRRYHRTNYSAQLVAAGIRLHYGEDGDWYRHLFFSFQPALHNGCTLALSSVYEFVSTLGWQGRRFSVQIRHISNGSLHKPNRGETMALFGAAFDL
ncbi:MAG: lipid A 3-O-deacylase [Rhodanobacter sp.]